MKPISARSRRPITVEMLIASISWRASVGSSTGVLPRRTIWRGPRTALAGLIGMIWPITIQSNKLPQGGEAQFRGRRGARLLKLLDIGGDVHALDGGEMRDAARMKPVEEFDRRARIGAARVRVANVGGEEFAMRAGAQSAVMATSWFIAKFC